MKKQSLIILILIILLTGTMLLGYFFQSSKRSNRRQSASVFESIGVKIDIQDIRVVQINGMRLEYAFDNEYWKGWIYKDSERNLTLPVLSEKVQAFLEDVKKFSQGRLVEAEPSDLAKYDLEESEDKEKAPYTVSLESWTGEKIFTFIISRSTDLTYARFQDDKAIYKVTSMLHSALSSDRFYWLDTRIFPSNIVLDDIETITINPQEGKKLLLRKEKEEKKKKKEENTAMWSLDESSATLDSSQVSRYVTSVIEAKAKDFSDIEVTESMRNSEVIFRLKDGSEDGVVLYSFADNFYIKRKSRYIDYTYLITKYLKEKLFPISEEMFIAEPKKKNEDNTSTM